MIRTLFTHYIRCKINLSTISTTIKNEVDAFDGPSVRSSRLTTILDEYYNFTTTTTYQDISAFHVTLDITVHFDDNELMTRPNLSISVAAREVTEGIIEVPISSEKPVDLTLSATNLNECRKSSGATMCVINVTVADWKSEKPTFVHFTIYNMSTISPNTHECDYGGLQMMNSFVHTGKGLKQGFPWLFAPAALCYKLHLSPYGLFPEVWPFYEYISRTRSLLIAYYKYSFIVTGNDDVVTMRFKTSSCQGVDILCGTSSPPYTGQMDVPGNYAGESVN